MLKVVSEHFFGVFSPKGELEAVDGTETMAQFSAQNLSPNPRKPNRIVRPVVICIPTEETA
ncbi:hypothetical protein [Mesorhizobium sp.]|uniref:hypothetical protein n=1 Tax=Mesorhizobium sp. TaxID=1871066 RepID=UPI001214B12D|nr:hypothetical protein [Mesorhizobium sp.]TIN84324.1 MAG: hypothetical protein E5X97_22385 [Mesorhizobium sp.]